MGIAISNQFNRPISSLMDEQAQNAQLLQLSIQPDGDKYIYSLHCSYTSQANIGGTPVSAQQALAQTFIQGRCVIVGSTLDLTGISTVDLLGFHPFQAPILFGAIIPNNVLFDIGFVNELHIDFDQAIVVGAGNALNVLLSAGFGIDDILTSSATKLGTLNVNGEIKTQSQRHEIKFR